MSSAVENSERYYRTMATPGGLAPGEAARAFQAVAAAWRHQRVSRGQVSCELFNEHKLVLSNSTNHLSKCCLHTRLLTLSARARARPPLLPHRPPPLRLCVRLHVPEQRHLQKSHFH